MRDLATLESAVNQPKNIFYYGQGDIFDVAAGYAFHIGQAQAFPDGNKRTAIGPALLFLEINGIAASFPWQTLYDGMIAIAERRMTRSDFANALREGNDEPAA